MDFMAFAKSKIFNANYTNTRMTRINPLKFAKFAHPRYSRSKRATNWKTHQWTLQRPSYRLNALGCVPAAEDGGLSKTYIPSLVMMNNGFISKLSNLGRRRSVL